MADTFEFSSCTPHEAGFCPQRTARILDVFSAEVQRSRLPGAVALVARHGKVLLHAATGRLGPHGAVTEAPAMPLDALFRIYSMTKPIVSVATMVLVERGQLLLGDPVAKYLPEFAQVQVAHFQGTSMDLRPPRSAPTVHDLLRHTSGLTYETLGDEPIQRMYVQAGLSSRDRSNRAFAQTVAGLPLMFEPGSTWEYSRATDVLGALVEVVSGQPLGRFLQENIFEPLGMADTRFDVAPEHLFRLAEPFPRCPDTNGAVQLIDVSSPHASEAGGNGLVSTALDYARFLQCMLSGGSLGGHRILSPSTVRSMTADHLGGMGQHVSQTYGNMLCPGTGFGLGFSVRLAEGMDDMAGSAGLYYWGGSAGTTFFVDPSKELLAVFMTQAPKQSRTYMPMFRNLVYAALMD